VVVIFGRPVFVPPVLDKETVEAKRAELEAELRGITGKADGFWER